MKTIRFLAFVIGAMSVFGVQKATAQVGVGNSATVLNNGGVSDQMDNGPGAETAADIDSTIDIRDEPDYEIDTRTDSDTIDEPTKAEAKIEIK